MTDQKPGRTFGGVDKWIKMTGERSMIDEKVNTVRMFYTKRKEGMMMKHYPSGKIVPLQDEKS